MTKQLKLPTCSEYNKLNDDDRERLYQKFCAFNNLNAESQLAIDEFFARIDKLTLESPEEEEE